MVFCGGFGVLLTMEYYPAPLLNFSETKSGLVSYDVYRFYVSDSKHCWNYLHTGPVFSLRTGFKVARL